MKTKVAVLKTSPATVLKDYGRLMRLASYDAFLSREKQTYLKTNIIWREWYPSSSTEPWQLEGVISTLIHDNFAPEAIFVAEGHAAGINPGAAEAYNGLVTAAGRHDVGIVRLDEPAVDWAPFSPKAEMLVLDRMMGEGGIRVPDIFLGNNVIHLPTVKTHARAGVAGAAMSATDVLLDELNWARDDIHEILVDLIAVQKEACGGLFTVMDGTLCGDGPGPRTLVPYEKDYILAGADPVAVDAVAARMMGFEPLDIEYIRLATERGVGTGDMSEITVAGEDISQVNFHFQGGKRPLVPPTNAYLEYFWYPFVGWQHVGRIAETGWGQLFQEYLPEGAELDRQGKGKGPVLALAAAAALMGISATKRVVRLARRGA